LNATNTNCIFAVTDLEDAKRKMLSWANRFGIFCFLDNHRYQTTRALITTIHLANSFQQIIHHTSLLPQTKTIQQL